jgi:hypothetical protein
VLNIIQSSVEITGCSKVLAFVGGTHLVDTDMEEKDDVASIAVSWRINIPKCAFIQVIAPEVLLLMFFQRSCRTVLLCFTAECS